MAQNSGPSLYRIYYVLLRCFEHKVQKTLEHKVPRRGFELNANLEKIPSIGKSKQKLKDIMKDVNNF